MKSLLVMFSGLFLFFYFFISTQDGIVGLDSNLENFKEYFINNNELKFQPIRNADYKVNEIIEILISKIYEIF